MWRSSPPSPAEAPGAPLTALAVAAVVAVAVGSFAPPGGWWALALIPAALVAAGCALRRPSRLAWWATAGALAGLGACALAAKTPARDADTAVPVRFVGVVRDGWAAGVRGWETRLALESLTAGDRSLRHPREVPLAVGGAAGLADLPEPGSRIEGAGEVSGNPATPLRFGWLHAKTVLLLRPAAGGSGVDRVRNAGVRALGRAAGVDPRRVRAASLAAALVLGRTEGLPEGDLASLRKSGLVHILSVSGVHVAMVSALAWGVLTLLGVEPRVRRWIVAATLVAFAFLAGGWAPVVRSATGGVAYLAARQFGRRLEPLPAVWAVVAGLLLVEPAAVVSVGFQLSAVVTLAIVRWSGPLAARLAFLPRPVATAAAVALTAQAASVPLVGQSFAAVPPLGVVASVLAAPLDLPLVLVALLALAASFLSVTIGGWMLALLAALNWMLARASDVGGAASAAFPHLPPAMAVAACLLGVWALGRTRGAAAAAVAFAGGTWCWVAAPGFGARPAGEMRMLSVRTGMALLLRTPRTAILVDAGRAPLDALRELASARVGRLDALVVTHPDADHTAGGAILLERLRVARLVYPAWAASQPEVVALCRVARDRGIAEAALAAGDRLDCGDVAGEVVWPPSGFAEEGNDASLVLRLRLGGVRLLVTGDLEAGGEGALLASAPAVASDLLQLGHHGSRTSSSPAFLAAVRPVVALAATGTHPRFAVPSPLVAARVRGVPAVLAAQNAGVTRVWWNGAGRVVVDAGAPVAVHPARRGGRD